MRLFEWETYKKRISTCCTERTKESVQDLSGMELKTLDKYWLKEWRNKEYSARYVRSSIS